MAKFRRQLQHLVLWWLQVFAVDYRLASEDPVPCPVEDVYAALSWLFEIDKTIGIDPTRRVIYGDSAGGGMRGP
ncbi:hypothetical protein VMCG_06941 [Cytospora schulzeri]|uniref:Alpha/beta hydrolase fold-3 domain-containing protein n=1 Tax=Cytospora schulzeri TaxID=448051 RepID=A0A423W268_9PEZI|nr:hypothetical protein VMCG_06941 [Valsa malicola]